MRVKVSCQHTWKQRVVEKAAREQQLRATVASVERLLETHPQCELLHKNLNDAAQELAEKEQFALEWTTIRSSAKWSQIEGRMDGDFFAHVSASLANTPIQMLRDEEEKEYTTTNEMASYANIFYQNLFISQNENEVCETTREEVWAQVPKKVSTVMNASLTVPITLGELQEAMKLLPPNKVSGLDGFLSNFFLVLWETLGTDLLETCQEAFNLGTMHQNLNTGTLCLIPKGGDKMNLRNW
jgi:hypothetical protein